MSIIFHHLVREYDGALPIDQNTPPLGEEGSQGLMINDLGEVYGKLISAMPITRYYYGLPFNAEGGLVFTAEPVAYYDQGIPFALDGAIAATAVPVDAEFYTQGMKYSLQGRFLVATTVIPMNPPDQVQNVVITLPSLNALHVTWTTPASPDEPINAYLVQYKLATDTVWIDQTVGVVNSTDIVNLTAGALYDVRVAANNLYGLGPFSTVIQARPETTPNAPINLQLVGGIVQISASWNAVVSYPTVTSYTIEWKKTNEFTWTVLNVGLNLSHVITGLNAGITYNVRVKATNVRGSSSYTEGNAVTLGLPAQVTGLTASAAVDSALLNWNVPASSPALTSYDIQLKDATNNVWFSFTQLTFQNSQTVAALAGGTLYTFRVRGVNANGFGPWSSSVTVTPIAVAAPAVVVLNNLGISMPPAAVSVANTGTGGATRNFSRQAGVGAALTYSTQKNRTCWASAGQRSLTTSAETQTSLAQPQTLIWAGIPTSVDGNSRYIWTTTAQLAEAFSSTASTRLAAGGTPIAGIALNTTQPYVIVFTLNGNSSFIRIIQSVTGIDSVVGPLNCGTNGVALNSIFWNWGLTAGIDFRGRCFELRQYNGVLSAAEELGVLRSITSKWFLDRSNIGPPVAEYKYNEKGVVSTGVGTAVTAWKNTGELFDVDNYTQVIGVGSVTHIARNGLAAISTTGEVRLSAQTAAAPIFTPYTVYVACRPTTVDANNRYIFKGTNFSFRVNSGTFTCSAGSTLTGTNGGGAVVLAMVANGTSSRFLGQGPTTLFDSSGNGGTNSYITDNVFWNTGNTENLSYIGEIFEVQVCLGAHTSPMLSYSINTLRAKWNI